MLFCSQVHCIAVGKDGCRHMSENCSSPHESGQNFRTTPCNRRCCIWPCSPACVDYGMRAYGNAPYPACNLKCIPRHCTLPNKGARFHSDENSLLLDGGGGLGERNALHIRALGRSCYTHRFPHTSARYEQLLHGPQQTCTFFRIHKASCTDVIHHRNGLPLDCLCRGSDLAWNNVARSRPCHMARNIYCHHSCAP